jgi:hypothetical protein
MVEFEVDTDDTKEDLEHSIMEELDGEIGFVNAIQVTAVPE